MWSSRSTPRLRCASLQEPSSTTTSPRRARRDEAEVALGVVHRDLDVVALVRIVHGIADRTRPLHSEGGKRSWMHRGCDSRRRRRQLRAPTLPRSTPTRCSVWLSPSIEHDCQFCAGPGMVCSIRRSSPTIGSPRSKVKRDVAGVVVDYAEPVLFHTETSATFSGRPLRKAPVFFVDRHTASVPPFFFFWSGVRKRQG